MALRLGRRITGVRISPRRPIYTRPTKEKKMKIALNSIYLVSPKQNAEIVKMISDGTINGKQAKELLSIVIDMNMKQIEDFLTKQCE